MRPGTGIKRRRIVYLLPLIALFILMHPPLAGPVEAQGGVALSGGFYRQNFEIPQGESVSAPSINVVVFNNSDEEMVVRMRSTAPEGVKIVLSYDEFTLKPGTQQKVMVAVEVGEDAIPGVYEDGVIVTAESYVERNTQGIQLAGASSQSADLTIPGESALIRARAVGPSGSPIQCVVRLYKIAGEDEFELSFSDTGVVEKRVAPGSFLVRAFVGTEKMAEERFEVAADDEKNIDLVVKTLYFESYDVVPYSDKDTGKLAYVKLDYTVRNLYQPVSNAAVVLQVTRDGEPLDEVTLITLDPLDVGRLGLNYNYIPLSGWESGTYVLRLDLDVDNKLYASTWNEEVQVSGNMVVAGSSSGGGLSTVVIGLIIAAVAVIIVAGGYLVIRRRQGLSVGEEEIGTLDERWRL